MKIIYCLVLIFLLIFSCNKNVESNSVLMKTDTLKQNNGKILTYPKFKKSLIILQRDQTVYSDNYKKRIRKEVEYYLANTLRSNVKYQLEQTNVQLGYSLEQNDWEDIVYTQIGIFVKSGNNISTMQWLFYEPKYQKLYEFDLYRKQLLYFNQK